MTRIVVTVDEQGQTTMKVEGATGSSCLLLTGALQKALGVTTEDRKLPEFYQTQQVKAKVKA